MQTPHHRCRWVPSRDALYCAYHDEEWGVPEWDSQALFEKLLLDGMQAGLAWITILRKRDTLREAYHGFNPERLARYDGADRARLLNNPGVIRSKTKIDAAITNAQAWLGLREQGVCFSDFLWSFVGGEPLQNSWTRAEDVPAQTSQSEAMSKALKEKGFKFCGPVIVYAFMQAVGMVNDHTRSCFRHMPVKILGQQSPFAS